LPTFSPLMASEGVVNVGSLAGAYSYARSHNGNYVYSHYTNIISTGQKLTCTIQLQPFPVLLDHPNGIFQTKV
jgi:hypothetical protein